MKTRQTDGNPFCYDRSAFVWEVVPRGSRAHLDFGCYEGRFLDSLRSRDVQRLVGVDVCREAIETGKHRYPQIELHHLTTVLPLPFDDATFSSVSIMDVIEHVDQQKALLDELHRVLAPDGRLIITVPGQYALSFLDMGNLKFRLPRLHRWFYCLRHSKKEYEYRYVANPDGLVGDISAEKGWHEHFSRKKLTGLLANSGFTPEFFDGSGFFARAIIYPETALGWIPPLGWGFRGLRKLDDRFCHSLNLFCIARKS